MGVFDRSVQGTVVVGRGGGTVLGMAPYGLDWLALRARLSGGGGGLALGPGPGVTLRRSFGLSYDDLSFVVENWLRRGCCLGLTPLPKLASDALDAKLALEVVRGASGLTGTLRAAVG